MLLLLLPQQALLKNRDAEAATPTSEFLVSELETGAY